MGLCHPKNGERFWLHKNEPVASGRCVVCGASGAMTELTPNLTPQWTEPQINTTQTVNMDE